MTTTPSHIGPLKHDDDRLVARAKAGDIDALADLYTRYRHGIHSFISWRISDRETAADLTADVFVAAIHTIGNLHTTGNNISAWLYKIASSRVADHYRSARVRLDTATAQPPDRADEDPLAALETTTLRRLDSQAVAAAINRLTNDRWRRCMTLRFIRGLPQSETAAAMGVGTHAIKMIQNRAIAELRRDPTLMSAVRFPAETT